MKAITTIFALVVLAGLGFLSYSSYTTNMQLKVLIQQNNELKEVTNDVNSRLSAIEKPVNKGRNTAAPGRQDNPLEKEAGSALNEINNLVASNQIDKAKKELADFLNKYKGTRSASRATRLSQELSVFGKDAPKKWGIEKWVQGKNDVNLESKQDTILLIFWEEWCGFCRREMPKVQKMYSEYKGKGLKVTGLTKINRSASSEKVTAFLKENNIQFPIAKEDGSMSNYFQVRGVPAAALINKGKIVWRGHPARLPMDMIKGYLNIK